MASEKKKFAVIGCQHGHIGIFIEEMQNMGYDCAGIYERDPFPVAQSLSTKYGIPLYLQEGYAISEIWNDAEIGIIGTSAINKEKIQIIELCDQYGKHVMLDKPAAVDRDGYERLLAVIQRGRIQVGMLLTERVNKALFTLKQQIDLGHFGKIVQIGIRKPHRLAQESRPSWFFDKTLNGTIIHDLFIHDYDLLRWLTGQEIESSSGSLTKLILPEHPSFYDSANVQVQLNGGATAQLYADWHTRDACWAWGDMRVFVTGTEAYAELRLSGDPLISSEPMLLMVTNNNIWTELPLDQAPYTICGDFLDRISCISSNERGNTNPDTSQTTRKTNNQIVYQNTHQNTHQITHEDILAATKAAVEANEDAQLIVTTLHS
ncbi:Gfo/Idh/MocA family protein [Paenibacillus eucommiae]|uniref:Dehydrogenase n=1 Tax=Paenibacillus eucommiae TaxID=1355755 RepID=A0ABS4IY59_9BACL|nr:Gfo/Idh/MocA family oxidoreductase [Paenibacillus eucommiae]MBP1992508.1 putative dehydrogenase [Paenibacillus eucommiae]